MTTATAPAVFYVSTLGTPEGGPGDYLGEAPTAAEALALCRLSCEIRKGPPADTTTRAGSARLTFQPWRLTLGTREKVAQRKPWALFVGGSAVNAYATQAEALGHCLARYSVALPALVDESGKLYR